MKTSVYNDQHKAVKEISLPEGAFAVSWRPALVKQALEAQLNNARRPWAHAKTRGEVSGGGRKPWRQKGTGRARHGSTRSPIWVGGGKAHGPRADRDYSVKINKKMRSLAILSLLSKKNTDKEMKVYENFQLEKAKTKALEIIVRGMIEATPRTKKFDVLLIPAAPQTALARAASNLGKVKVLPATSLNIYDLMNYKHLILGEGAVEVIAERYAKAK
jgi:large subunit ribosomal protein L4